MSDQLDIFEQPRTGRFYGRAATATERESGEAVEARDVGPLRKGSAGHKVLRVYGDRVRRTSYEASWIVAGDWHSKRRESTRLVERGFLRKNGTMANRAPAGRKHVDAYEITDAGVAELRRLDGP